MSQGSGLEAAEPFSREAFAGLRAHPAFHAAVADLAAGNLARYAAAAPAERWLTSDLGRAALTGAVVVLEAMTGGVATALFVQSVVANGTCSEGRARLYLRRAAANGYLAADGPGRYRTTPRLAAFVERSSRGMLGATARLDPGLEAALAQVGEPAFRRRFGMHLGLNTAARPDLFKGPEMPAVLFLDHDGGTRMLEQLITALPARRGRLLETAPFSRRALAAGAHVSRTHVARLLAEGEARGLLTVEGRRLVVAPALSDDIERHYALVFEMARASARAALAA